MKRRVGGRGVAPFVMGAYAVCVVLAISFILFEVLDIDGSNLAVTGTGPALTSESEFSSDLKRSPSVGPAPMVLLGVPDARATSREVVQSKHAHDGLARHFPVALGHGYRAPLARASLPASPAA